MFNKIFRFYFVLILVIGLFTVTTPQPAYAAGPWYVATTGNDNNDCLSSNSPCATVNGAIGKASAGDTVKVAAGTYTGVGSEVVLIDKDATLTGGWDLTFTVQSGVSTIDGQNARGDMTTFGTVVVDHFSFQNGLAFAGAGIWNGGTITVNNSIFNGNAATGFIINYPGGGGIYNNGGTVTLNNSTLSRNKGSGITNDGTLTINNSDISNNEDYGIANLYGRSAVINHSTVSNNTNDGIFNRFDLTVGSSTIKNNAGHGIQDWDSRISVLNNSTVSGNNAGGILQIFGGSLTLDSTTVSSNIADAGGGISMQGGTVTLQNTILAGNAANSGPDCNGTINTLGYNLIGDPSGCTFASSTGDLTNVVPNLGQLIASSGTPSYHPLLSASPAIDAGNPAGCTDQDGNLLVVDQRGVARVGTCDIGAYEYTVPGPAVELSAVGGNNQSTATTLAFPQPLQVATLDSLGSPVSGVSIDLTAPGSGASGTFANTGTNTTSVITDVGGVATASIFTANSVEGAYTVSASATGLGSVDFSLEQVARPANDNFAQAQPIAALPFSATANITQGTNESNEPQACYSMDRTVWYLFTPTESMVVRASTNGSATNANVNIYQATGPGISNLQFLSCTGPDGAPTFHVEANQTYYVQAGAIFGGIGSIQLKLEQVPPPANDNFANATQITSLPFNVDASTIGATFEAGEPTPACWPGYPLKTVWFTYTPSTNTPLSTVLGPGTISPLIVIYTGSSFNNLTALDCSFGGTSFMAQAGVKYYFQLTDNVGNEGTIPFTLEFTPPPTAEIFYSPSDPNVFDTVFIGSNTADAFGIASYAWTLSDGATSQEAAFNHQFARDGDYTANLTVTSVDGLTGSASQVIHVRTHDVAITKVIAPQSARSGQTKAITVAIRNTHYPETVTVDLYKSTPGGDVWIGAVTLQVPVLTGNKTKQFTFNYTFTSQDVQIGKVTFRAVATINGSNDAFPQDNTGISSPPTRVAR